MKHKKIKNTILIAAAFVAAIYIYRINEASKISHELSNQYNLSPAEMSTISIIHNSGVAPEEINDYIKFSDETRCTFLSLSKMGIVGISSNHELLISRAQMEKINVMYSSIPEEKWDLAIGLWSIGSGTRVDVDANSYITHPYKMLVDRGLARPVVSQPPLYRAAYYPTYKGKLISSFFHCN